MIRLFFIEQDIARATNKQKFPMQTNTGHWTLPFEYIFSKIYRKKHFISSPKYSNTKHLNDLSLLTSDKVTNFQKTCFIALDILASMVWMRSEGSCCNHLASEQSDEPGQWQWCSSVAGWRAAPTFSTITQLGPARRGKLFSQSWTPHLSYFNFFFGCLFHLNKRYNFHFLHFKNI